jgi:hypothetical protein
VGGSPQIVVISSGGSSAASVFFVVLLLVLLAGGAFLFRNFANNTAETATLPTAPVPSEDVDITPIAPPEIISNPEKSEALSPTPPEEPDAPPPVKDTPKKAPPPPVYTTKLRPANTVRRRTAANATALDREVWAKLNATPQHPVAAPPERDEISLLVERYMATPFEKVVPNPLADTFPGAVPETATRVAKTVNLPANIAGWQSTGVYAPAGELIRVRIGSQDIRRGLRVQIGCHTDNLLTSEDAEEWRRFPVLTTSTPVKQSETQIANPFGGLVYVCTPGGAPADRNRIRIEIIGAVEAPFYRLGETTKADWQHIRQAPAPWGELVCRTVTLSVPSEHLRDLDDPEKLMRIWEKIIDDQDWLAALPKRITHPERLVPDVQISAGYMHSGYPVMCHANPSARDMVDAHRLTTDGDWGFFHEYGHNHQRGEWTFAGFGEVTCNLFALYNMETTAGKKRGEGMPDLTRFLAEKLADPHGANAADHLLAIYLPVLREFGWETLRKTFAEYNKPDTQAEIRMKRRNATSHSKSRRAARDGTDSEPDKNDEQNKEMFVRLWSKHTKRNLGPYFEKVGFPYTSSMKSRLSSYKPWMPPEVVAAGK